MKLRLRTRMMVLAAAAALVSVCLLVVPRYLRAAALVVNASGIDGRLHEAAAWRAARFRTENALIPSRHGNLRGRLYRPEGKTRGVLLLAPGVHAGGVDEPRLVDFAGHLAARRFAVLTVALPDLVHYRITPRATDMVEDSARWLSDTEGLGHARGVGMVGVSFSGGLSLVAAGRPGLRDRVTFVLSLGGHGNLRRTLRYLCSGILADGSRQRPHDYGVAIGLLALADRMVPPAQAQPLRNAVLRFLEASHLDAIDHRQAAVAFADARALERELPEPAATYLKWVNRREVTALGAALLPHAAAMDDDPALSPELAAPPAAPVYLLHGEGDNVIPSLESRLLARHLERSTRVKLLVTPTIRHAEIDRRPGLRDVARLIAFWADALDE